MSRDVCWHLEKKLRVDRKKGPPTSFWGVEIDQLAKDNPAKKKSFQRLLSTLPLQDWEKELLTYRFFYNLTYTELAENYGYTNRSSTKRLVDRILEKLRKVVKELN